MTEPTEPQRAPQGMQFNAPPGWPPPPPGWVPPPGFVPDPSWPAAPPDWQWWAPTRANVLETTTVLPASAGAQSHPGPDFAVGAPPAGPPFAGGPHPPAGLPPVGDQRGSWVGRHRLLTIALVVVGLLFLGGVATAGVVLANRADTDKSPKAAGGSAQRTPSTEPSQPSPQPSASQSSAPSSAENKAACDKAAAPHGKVVTLLRDLGTRSVTNAAAVAAIPPIQSDLNAAADTATGSLQRDLREYAAALGGLRTALMQGRDSAAAAAKVVIYSILIKAECGL